MTHYFKTDYGIDERFLGILEDSIYFNPLLTRNDKDALVTSLYSLFYESKKNKQVYTLHELEKPYKVPLVEETDVISIAEHIQAAALKIKGVTKAKSQNPDDYSECWNWS